MVVLVVLITGLAFCATAYAKPGQVTVRVIDPGAKGKEKTVQGAVVTLFVKEEDVEGLPPGWVEVAQDVTDKNGKATLPTAAGKTYITKVTAPDGRVAWGDAFTTGSNGGASVQTVQL